MCYAEKAGDDVGDPALRAHCPRKKKSPSQARLRRSRSALCLSATLANRSYLAGQLGGPRQSARPRPPTPTKKKSPTRARLASLGKRRKARAARVDARTKKEEKPARRARRAVAVLLRDCATIHKLDMEQGDMIYGTR